MRPAPATSTAAPMAGSCPYLRRSRPGRGLGRRLISRYAFSGILCFDERIAVGGSGGG
jgi:hypothetical protein